MGTTFQKTSFMLFVVDVTDYPALRADGFSRTKWKLHVGFIIKENLSCFSVGKHFIMGKA